MRLLFVLSMLALIALPGGHSDTLDRPSDGQPEFTFARLVYSGGWRSRSSWAVDYPKADRQFLFALRKLTDFTFVDSQLLRDRHPPE